MKNKSNNKIIFIFFFSFILLFILFKIGNSLINNSYEEINFAEAKKLIEEGVNQNKKIKIKEHTNGKVEISISTEEVKETEKEKGITYDEYITFVNPRESSINTIIENYEVDYKYIVPTNYLGQLFSVLFTFVILLILIILFNHLFKTDSKFTRKQNIPKITFEDIGGLTEETKNEIMQVKELLERPKDAKKLGLKPSKGLLLYGPTGTGKTLIAQALAHAYNAHFIPMEASKFIELYTGRGAKRVRDLFKEAKKYKQAIIFIDEIDAIGKKRSDSLGNQMHDEREQTLNQLLVCMDGIEENQNIFVVAATNRIDILDPALLRPGRFDYKVMVGLPDKEGRKEIINIHTRNKQLNDKVKENIDDIAKSTAGFSGAEIESLFNLAGYRAFSQNRNCIQMEDVQYGIDRIIMGSEGKRINNIETKRRVAFHEAGHAIISSLLFPNSIRKATIVPRGQALGYVAYIPKEDIMSEEELKKQLMIMVAGGVAEKIIFNNHSNGVADDFKKAKQLIEKMIEDWGMGISLLIPFSKEEKEKIMKNLYKETIENTKKLMMKNKELLIEVAERLLEEETIDGFEIEKMKEKYIKQEELV